MKMYFTFAILVMMMIPKISIAEESCSVPESLKNQIAKQFPEYRLPRASDNHADSIAYNRQHGGNGCLGLTRADFDGDGNFDHAILLTELESDNTLLVVALFKKKGWVVEKLLDLGSDRATLYVGSLEPGRYVRAGSLNDSDLEPGEVRSYTSTLTGIVTGTVESSGVAYFRTSKGWVHVWISD
jgi:hypothetical protein